MTLGSVGEERIDTGEFIPGGWRSEVTQMRTVARPVSGYRSSKVARVSGLHQKMSTVRVQ